jgi:hypothetical protein
LTAKIAKITAFGVVQIVFSQPIIVPGNFTKIDDSVMKINIVPKADRFELKGWNVTSFRQTMMEIKV